ncbi:MAG: CDP-alcohol phosphatidyltransferase family protein [Zestosphaera sp.]
MLGRIRVLVTPALLRLGLMLWRLGVTPNIITLTGLLLSLVAPCFALLGEGSAVLALLVASLVCDMLDGAVAKASGSSSPRGALLDSVSDRVEELMFALSIGLLGIDWVLLTLFLGTSFLISYLRAIAIQHGVNLEGVGLMERGERGLLTVISLTLLIISQQVYAKASMSVGVLLNVITVLERLRSLSNCLKSSPHHRGKDVRI